MNLKDISFASPEENILFDDVLLSLAEEGRAGEALRFWESEQTFVVLGRISKVGENIFIKEALKDKIPVLRRSSGGGVVLQGKGCLNYSLILSKELNPQVRTLHKSYEFILGKLIQSLKSLGTEAVFKPVSDMAVKVNNEERKFSGNAQRRGKKFILHHGTILYDFPLEDIEKYLKVPVDVPDYRRERAHRKFLTNITISPKGLKESLAKIFCAYGIDQKITGQETEALSRFLKTREVRVVI
ncbi:MAG TPA: lipoate--protein ligase family protein [Candidatus Omnitrophota bacterium]|nr:lipoate--protein ligase family protein [Candidatus Omnitrophota bacterium]HPD85116.1 lipoate--protein ligase family protein [Candidatus Omnitrophota bacterium]HRZ03974.1 lipoate--protein ligase family protein [Candidatus Omnitrophota bacterium]